MGHYIKFITENTNKTIEIINAKTGEHYITANTNNEFYLETDINGYIAYISNPIVDNNMTGILNFLHSTLGQILSISMILIIVIMCYAFFKFIKKGGFS